LLYNYTKQPQQFEHWQVRCSMATMTLPTLTVSVRMQRLYTFHAELVRMISFRNNSNGAIIEL
jgi:hypothetical protein